jgi:hypothetical protein
MAASDPIFRKPTRGEWHHCHIIMIRFGSEEDDFLNFWKHPYKDLQHPIQKKGMK